MKSSVTSRKQRFWALLLAVVMVVGLLPTAGVKAANKEITKDDLASEISVGTIFDAGDELSGTVLSDIQGDGVNPGDYYVRYLDIDDTPESSQISSWGRAEDGKLYKTVRDVLNQSDDPYLIRSYKNVFSSGNVLEESQSSNKWIVVDGIEEDEDEDDESNDQYLYLRALPKYTITWNWVLNQHGAEVTPSTNTLPVEFIPYVSDSIDLSTITGTADKDGYKFAGWLHLGNTNEDGVYEFIDDKHGKVIKTDTCDKFDSYEKEEPEDEEDEEEENHSYRITLKAAWTPYYTIEYAKGTTADIANEVTGDMDSQEIEMPWLIGDDYDWSMPWIQEAYDDDYEVELLENQYVRNGYIFNGWLRKDGNGGYYKVESFIAGQDVQPGSTITLYADWIKIPEFIIKYHPGGQQDWVDLNSISGEMAPQEITSANIQNATLTPNVFAGPGYRFVEWDWYVQGNDNPDNDLGTYLGSFDDKTTLEEVVTKIMDKGYEIDPESSVFINPTNKSELTTIDLYAWWEKPDLEYTVRFDNNIPTPEVTSTPIPTYEPVTVSFWENEIQGEDEPEQEGDAEGVNLYGTIKMPEAPTNGDPNYDPRHYKFLGWKIGEGENAKIYQPNEIPFVKDIIDAAGINWEDGIVKYIENDNEEDNEEYNEVENPERDPERDPAWEAPVITAVAQWEAKNYDILFDVNAGEGSANPTITPSPVNLDDKAIKGAKFDAETPIAYPDVVDTEDNYGVAGWSLEPKGGNKDFPIGEEDKVKDIVLEADGIRAIAEPVVLDIERPAGNNNNATNNQQIPDGVITLYALWQKYYKVIYNPNGASEEPFAEKAFSDQDFVAISNKNDDNLDIFTFDGHQFAGWNTQADGKGTLVKPGEKIYFSGATVVDLYAQWDTNTYAVKFDTNGHGEVNNDTVNVNYGNTVTVPEITADEGYNLEGWYINYGKADEALWDFSTPVKEDITLTAKWSHSLICIIFDVNKENYEGLDSEELVNEFRVLMPGSSIAFPALIDPEMAYEFLGWARSADAKEAEFKSQDYEAYTLEDAIEDFDDSEFDGEKIKLYAVWTKKTYVIWQDGDGEIYFKAEVNPETGDYNKYNEEPQKDHYEFDGWEDPSDEDGNTIYIAKFKPKKYNVKFVDYDDKVIDEKQYEYGTEAAKVVKPANPTRSGYTFTGWNPAKIADVTDNATYKATYTKINSNPVNPGGNGGGTVISPEPTKYTITWIDGNGNEIYSDEVAEGSTPVYDKAKHGTPTKNPTGYATYSFNNTWSPAITKVTGDQEYVAQFDMFGPEGGQENPTPTVTPTVTPTPTSTPTPAAPAEYDIEYYEELPDGTEVQLKKTNNPDKYTYGVGAEIKYGIDKEGYTFEGWYSKRSKKYVKKVGTKTKGTVKLYAIFVPDDSGKGNEGDNGKGLPTDFSTLLVRLIDYTENSMTLKWEKMEYVDGYDILGSRCNSKDVIRPYEPIVSVDADTDEYVMSDLLAKTYYKFYVRAFILVNGEKRYITTSINVHGVTLNDTYGVADELEIEKVVAKYINGKSKTKYVRSTAADDGEINITLKVGQSLKIVTSEYNKDGKEIRAHRPISFESSDPAICKIGKKSSHKYGVVVADKANTYKSHTITALAAGECDIYVFAQNGVYKTIHVTVK